jgi:hypothetical protein
MLRKFVACELRHVSTPSINSTLLLKRYDSNQLSKQVAVARSEIRAVVKQLPVEMLQQFPSASSCMRTGIIMTEHYTGCQHSTPFVLSGPTQFFKCFAILF